MSLILPSIGSNLVTGQAPFDTTLIEKSVWMDGSADGFTRAASDFDNEDGKEFTLGTWFQLTEFGVSGALFCADAGSNVYTSLRHGVDNKIFFQTEAGSAILSTPNVYRDIGWYHLLLSVDTTQTASSNRVRLFINGEEVTLSGTQPSVNHAYEFNLANKHEVGDSFENGAFEGYLAQSFMIGSKSIQQGDFAITDFLDTYTFGTNGSQFIPKKHSEIKTLVDAGSDNSFLLDYEPADPTASNALGLDISSYGNNFTSTSMGSANQSENTPSKLYPIINVIDHSNNTLPTLSEGNLRSAGPGASRACLRTTIPIPTTGKWYWEAKWNSVASARIGFAESTSQLLSNCGQSALSWGIQNDGTLVNNNSSGSALFSWSTNDIIAMAYDADASKFWFGRIPSGSTSVTWASSGNPETGANATVTSVPTQITPALDTNTGDVSLFFPEEDWTLSSKLSGFKEINSANLTAPDFIGADYFDVTLYEGNGAGQRVGDFVPVTDVGTITKSFLCDGHTNSGTTDLTISTGISTAPTNTQVKTLSFWIKPVSVREQHVYNASTDATDSTDSSERIYIATNGEVAYQTRQSGSAVAIAYTAGARINDSSQWFNVVVALNYDSATAAANTLKIYVDGVEQTLFSGTDGTGTAGGTLPAPGMTDQAYINKASTRQLIGTHPGFTSANSRSNCYLAEMYMVDGQALDASAFGVLDTSTNRWVPKAPATIKSTITGTGAGFGGCGFYLDFLDASDLGDDDSGNNRDFTESATIGTENQVADVPSKNYAVYNTVKGSVYTAMSMSEGNLTTKDGNGSIALATGFPIQEGYWYYEVNTVEDVNNMVFGLFNPATTVTASTSNPSLSGIQVSGATLVMQNNGGSNSTAGPTLSNPSAGDVVGIYIRKVGNSYGMWFSLNGTAMSNTPAATATATPDISFAASIELVPAVHYSNSGTKEAQTNFGQLLQFDGGATSFNAASDGYWKHAPVTGFKALNQDNLDETASKLTAWAWIKNRDADDDHVLVDRIRGTGKVWESNTNTTAFTNPDTVQRFLQRGVQVGNDVTVNTANESYVLWQWLVGDSATTGSTTSPAGTIASTTIVADTGHFSVGSYIGNGTDNSTIGHGLGGIPEIIIVRNLSRSTYGLVWHTDGGGATHTADFAVTATFSANSAKFGGSDADNPTADVFKIGDHNEINANTESFVFYALRSIPGVCKVGSYEGNADPDGAYISLGFKPRWFMVKNLDTAGQDWRIYDTAIEPINPNDQFFKANANAAQISSSGFDFLSDGVKARDGNSGFNSSATFIYMAMAEIGGGGTLPPIYGR